jgi:hypothetical protein
MTRLTGDLHSEFAQSVLDARDDALRDTGRQVLFGQNSNRSVSLGLENFLLRRSPRIHPGSKNPVLKVGVRVLVASRATDIVGSDELRVRKEGL